MFHMHNYGKREEDGYQYCSKCGKARKLSCNHKWNLVVNRDIEGLSFLGNSGIIGSLRVYECEYCGEMKQEKVGI